MIDIGEAFDLVEDEFLKFDRIPEGDKLHKRADICAFLLLDKLVPSNKDIVIAADHDSICLSTDVEALAKAATQDDILTLRRCGVMYSEEHECLTMFV